MDTYTAYILLSLGLIIFIILPALLTCYCYYNHWCDKYNHSRNNNINNINNGNCRNEYAKLINV